MENDLKTIADSLAQKKGQARGETLLNKIAFIRKEKGEAGVQELEKKLKDLGHPFSIKEVRSLGWYPEYISVLILLVSQEIFGWSEKEIIKMGSHAPKISFIVKMLMKYFVSAKMTFEASPRNWKKHHSAGNLELGSFDEKNKKCTLRLVDYDFHPLMCEYLRGYFQDFAKLVLRTPFVETTSESEIKNGKSVYTFNITWK